MKRLITTIKILLTALVALTLGMGSCFASTPTRWTYIMCIKHPTKDIALTCLNTYGNFLSSSTPKQVGETSEFKDFSVFGSRGTVDIDVGFEPDGDTRIKYVTNEVEMSIGESIVDFNGFTIVAESNGFVVSNGKKKISISEKHDWSEITANGSFEYGGPLGVVPVDGWKKIMWELGLRDSFTEDKGPAKPHRYWKWCISPMANNPEEFEVYSVYIPEKEVVWRKRRIWFTSADENLATETSERALKNILMSRFIFFHFAALPL